MYAAHFSLQEKPFAITPDPRYLFLSERHADALAHLLYGINEAGGFIQLTGEVGTGKTTLVRALLERLPGHADVAVLLNPRISPLELLQSICQELGVTLPEAAARDSVKALVDALNERLLAAHANGRRVIVVLDEAQNLSGETLEQLRLLTNLETASRKLLQIILVGQPELRAVLERRELRQLAQRVTGRFHLTPLSRADTAAYIRHRLKVAGAGGDLFSAAALKEIHRISGGVPRVINIICDRALLGAYTQDLHRIDAALARSAASEALGRRLASQGFAWASAATAALVAGLLGYGSWRIVQSEPPATPPAMVANDSATPAVPPLIEIQTLFATQPNLSDGNVAFDRLFKLWGAQYASEQGHPCEQALQQGLQCAHQRGSWGQLRLLNRPAILSLDGADGQARQIVIAALADDSADVMLDAGSQRVSLTSLSRTWQGEYLILWRPPWMANSQSPEQRDLSIGMRGDEVRWLRRGLDQLSGAPSDGGNDYFDAKLAERIQEFQRQHHLSVDGIAGVQTQIALDSLLDSSAAPRLLAKPASEG